jgi:Fur family ferric uptake transcriptional regulator
MSTIYRDLETLCDHGKIQVLEVGCSKKHFDAVTSDHYHARCIRCGRVTNLPVQPFSYLEKAFRDLCEYEIMGHRLELIGLCPQCLKQQREERMQASLAEAATEAKSSKSA